MYILHVFYFAVIYETIICVLRKINRRKLFKKAVRRAEKTGKQLLVVGDPYNGIASITTGRDYGCGDLCIDITGCPKCDCSLKIKLEDFVDTYKLDKYVIYISCVLEYVDDIDKILLYLNNINENDLYVVAVEQYAIFAYMYPYFITGEKSPKRIIYIDNNKIKYKNNPLLYLFKYL